MVHQRTNERRGVARIADRQRRIGLGQFGYQIVLDRVVRDQTAQRSAALARCADCRKDDGAHGHVDVGRRRDDHGIVAAKLEDRTTPARCNLRADNATHSGRAGCRNDRYILGVHQCLTDGRAADDKLHQTFRSLMAKALQRAVHDLHRGHRGKRRLFGRLPDHRDRHRPEPAPHSRTRLQPGS
jgi:hypothetical protein